MLEGKTIRAAAQQVSYALSHDEPARALHYSGSLLRALRLELEHKIKVLRKPLDDSMHGAIEQAIAVVINILQQAEQTLIWANDVREKPEEFLDAMEALRIRIYALSKSLDLQKKPKNKQT